MSDQKHEPNPRQNPVEEQLTDLEYIGDGVYVGINAYWQITMMLGNGVQYTNFIYLEPEVITKLEKYINMYKAKRHSFLTGQ